MKSLQQYINESRFGTPKTVYGKSLDGKDCTYKSHDGKDTFKVSKLRFNGDAFIGLVDGDEVVFHIVSGFGQHLDGSTVPMKTQNTVNVNSSFDKKHKIDGVLEFDKDDVKWENI